MCNELNSNFRDRLETSFPDVEPTHPVFTHNPGYTMQVYDELEEEWGL